MRKAKNIWYEMGAIIIAVIMIQGAWAADIEMNGEVSVSGTLSANAVTGDGSGLSNISGSALSNASVTQDKLAGGTVGPTQLANDSVTPVKISFLGKVAIVAVDGGDYSDPAAAMSDLASWCRPADDTTTPCLLKIMPGEYDVGANTVVMQPYVDIEGSGEKVTVITGASGESFPPNGTVSGANNAEIRFLTVSNTGGGSAVSVSAVTNNGKSPAMTNVTATASGGTYNYGVYNSSSSPTMTNVTATASGGTLSNGVYNSSSSPTMTNVTATASTTTEGSNNSNGVLNSSSSPTMTNVTATASGGLGSHGVHNTGSSKPVMKNVTATGSGGTYNHGVLNESSAFPVMTNVTATASGGSTSYGIASFSSSVTMTNVTATASDGTTNYGVYTANPSSKATMTNVTATAKGGNSSYAVGNSNCSPTMTNVTATALDGTNNYGVFNSTGGTVKINHSVISGTKYTIYSAAGVTTMVGNTQLDGGPISGTLTCVGAYDGNYVALGINCQP